MLAVKKKVDINKVKARKILEDQKTDLDGLTSAEVRTRQNNYGFNEIVEKRRHPLLKLLSLFYGPIPIMIEVAAILSLLIHHYTDFFIIIALLLMNVVVSFWHESKADNAIEMLKQKLAPQARVRRDGQWRIIPARELVPGDIIRLRLGDIIPADLELIDGDYLECDESTLTGESLPKEKHLLDNAYSGSVVVRGEMNGVVFATGSKTFFGKTAKLIQDAKTKSHFEKALIKIGNYLMVVAITLAVLIVIVSLFRAENLMETLRFVLVLAVASIPVALPAVLTICMTVGAISLARKRAIVSKLSAIEELAGVDVLCSDKTGTLTKNQLTVGQPVPAKGYTKDDVLFYATLASRKEDNDNIDNAILSQANNSIEIRRRLAAYQISEFKPFDPVIKRTESTVTSSNGERLKATKGASQVIFDLVGSQNSELEQYKNKVDEFAQMGYRMIAVAYQNDQQKWKLVGLVPLFDPPREDSAPTIAEAMAMGVKIKMVTGDNVSIAKQIARKLGLKTNIVAANQFENLTNHKLEELIENANGFAEVFPEHKFSIVKILQNLKHFVGMTGDGVNDAPALKKADCGIAVAGATDAAKSAASIVLTTPGISVIIDAIKESRIIFQRMNSYAIYRIAETMRVLFFITLSILVFNFYPVTAVMIVLLALLNDVPIIAIAYDNVHYSKNPERWNMNLVLGLGTMLGLIGVMISFLIFYIGKDVFHLNAEVLQSFIFLKLAIAGHLTIFLSRTRGHFWSIKPSDGLLWSAIITKIIATLFAVFGWFVAPIGWKMALVVWGYAIVTFVLTDWIKIYFYNILNLKANSNS